MNIDRVEKVNLLYYDCEQGSQEWINYRNMFITGSMVGKIVGNTMGQEYKHLVEEKSTYGKSRTFFGNVATNWGHKYEPVANMLFKYESGLEVFHYGLVHNPKYPRLAVSPDGITSDGHLLEIKCPYSRKIDGHISKEYTNQIQMQMHVCEIDACHFFECNFVEINQTRFEEIAINNVKEKPRYIGVIIRAKEKEGYFNYHSPIELYRNLSDIQDWIKYRTEDIIESDGDIAQMVFWALEKSNDQIVKRDSKWYDTHKFKFSRFWNHVVEAKEGAAITQKKQQQSCLIPWKKQ
jgi:putative phage-type endonuclease